MSRFPRRRPPLLLAVALTLLAAGSGLPRPCAAQSAPPDSLRLAGVNGPIRIRRDRYGVPDIRARSDEDALFGLGYVHAQDRLWEMEYQRRLGNGRLAEILGPNAQPNDVFFRTLGLNRAAASAWASLPADARRSMESYAAGVNAFIATLNAQNLPDEFRLLGIVRPEPWRPEDSLVWIKTLAWILGGNWEAELMRARLARLGFTPEQIGQLLPPFMARDPIILQNSVARAAPPKPGPALASLPALGPETDALLALHRTLRERFRIDGREAGSNGWVLSGTRTTNRRPLLANDPHLPSQIPSTWYLARVRGGALDVIGATLPGVPAVACGHNGRIAWGITNTGADVQDLYVEQITGNQVIYAGRPEPLTVVTETIKVRNQDGTVRDVVLPVRITRHGPVISDVVAPGGQAFALRWTGLDPQDDTMAAFLRVNRARNWQEFTAALSSFKAPMQNFLYADAEGNIGLIAPGALPLRAGGNGTVPVDGSGVTGNFEWTGYVPFEELPQTFNPPQGYIVSANNRVAPAGYPHLISTNFAPYYRAARIVEMIASKPQLSSEDVAAMQGDVNSVHAREVLPRLLEATPADDRSRAALALLRGWDGSIRADSAQAAIFEAWLMRIPVAIFADELRDPALFASYRGLRYVSDIATANVVNDPSSPWWDDVRTADVVEDSRTIMGRALAEGLAAMAPLQGTDDLRQWRWDRVHSTVFPHQFVPDFSRDIPNGGDRFTVNTGLTLNDSFEQRHVAGFRKIVVFGDLNASRFITTPGQSGDPKSPHYADLLKPWQRVEYLPMRFDGPENDQDD